MSSSRRAGRVHEGRLHNEPLPRRHAAGARFFQQAADPAPRRAPRASADRPRALAAVRGARAPRPEARAARGVPGPLDGALSALFLYAEDHAPLLRRFLRAIDRGAVQPAGSRGSPRRRLRHLGVSRLLRRGAPRGKARYPVRRARPRERHQRIYGISGSQAPHPRRDAVGAGDRLGERRAAQAARRRGGGGRQGTRHLQRDRPRRFSGRSTGARRAASSISTNRSGSSSTRGTWSP